IARRSLNGQLQRQFSWQAGASIMSPAKLIILTAMALLAAAESAPAIETVPPFAFAWGQEGSGAGEFSFPSGIAIGASGVVYISDENDRIQMFTRSGTYLWQWGSSGSADGQFLGPNSIGITSAGEVVVADYGNARIQVFSSSGTFLRKW